MVGTFVGANPEVDQHFCDSYYFNDASGYFLSWSS